MGSGGPITPVPPGATTPSGTVFFNLNNQQQSAVLNSSGQATVTFTLPFFTLLTSQTLQAMYVPADNSEQIGSIFTAPLYMNFNNLILPATLTFGQLTPQQRVDTTGANGNLTSLTSFYTAQGESNSFGLFTFLYTDPGTINQIQVLGFTIPGSFAAQFNAFGPTFSGQSSSM